jgi:hypothetical protein
LPTPKTLAPNTTWALALLDAGGKIEKSLIVRLTDIPVKTECDGDQRRIDIISDHGTDDSPKIYKPTYVVEGAALRISLSTFCDDGYALIGGVTRGGFEGYHTPETMIVGKGQAQKGGRVYGVPLAD